MRPTRNPVRARSHGRGSAAHNDAESGSAGEGRLAVLPNVDAARINGNGSATIRLIIDRIGRLQKGFIVNRHRTNHAPIPLAAFAVRQPSHIRHACYSANEGVQELG